MQAEQSAASPLQYEGPIEERRTLEVVYAAFRVALKQLLLDPVNEDGRSLL